MSQYRRSSATGATFFFTVNTYRRQPLLVDDRVRHALRTAVMSVRELSPFHIHAWVLLPDHLHCIWELPAGDSAFGKRWSQIKRHVSQSCREMLCDVDQTPSSLMRREVGLWQRRFWEHQIRDDADYHRHMDYIHWNPVKHGLVDRVADWPYSTFHRYVQQGLYMPDWCLGQNRVVEL